MGEGELGFYLIVAIIAMSVCMALTPLMMRLAPHIGMVDAPDARKVHTTSIPRSGGIGIVLGMLVPLLMWLPHDALSNSIVVGCCILLVFGSWDDARNIRPVIKFVGQFVAAAVVVYYGDLYVRYFPLVWVDAVEPWIGKPITVIAIVGMVNALNLSDGLDGLAGGEALISLVAVAYMAYEYGDGEALLIAAATIGGIFGFLRFNSHPARIFMGDSGSQTLGFLLGVLVVYLTQVANPVLSPVVALLLLGLPVIDSIVVFAMRAKRGDSLVVAAKDHLHHRLLKIGFYHYESVMIIYSLQILFSVIAVLLPYESDAVLLAIYLGVSVMLYVSLMFAENSGWRAHLHANTKAVFLSGRLLQHPYIQKVPFLFLEGGVSIAVIASALMSTQVPVDIGISSVIILVLILVSVFMNAMSQLLQRLLLYIVVGTSAYLIYAFPPSWLLMELHLAYVFYGVILISAFMAVRLVRKDQFVISPLDYLVVVMAIVAALAPGNRLEVNSITWLIIQMIILFYAVELMLQNMRVLSGRFVGVVSVGLVLLSLRAFL